MDICTVRRLQKCILILQHNMILKKFRPRFIHIYMCVCVCKYAYVYTYINMYMYVLEKEMATHSSIPA